jgi:hypothetical protein
MHFGNGRICRQVTRTKWLSTAVERGLVYCEGEHCLIVPTVCRNLSRITADTPLDIETAAGPPEDPIDPPSSANMLGGQRFVDEQGPLAMRRLQLEPPPGSPEEPPLPEVVTDAGNDPPPGPPPPDPFPDPRPPPLPPPIPEPSTWIMMMAGLALVVGTARRRRAARGARSSV